MQVTRWFLNELNLKKQNLAFFFFFLKQSLFFMNSPFSKHLLKMPCFTIKILKY